MTGGHLPKVVTDAIDLPLREIDANTHHGVVPASLAKSVMLGMVEGLFRALMATTFRTMDLEETDKKESEHESR